MIYSQIIFYPILNDLVGLKNVFEYTMKLFKQFKNIIGIVLSSTL